MKPKLFALRLASSLAALVLYGSSASAVTVLLAEDFDALPLQTSPTYGVPNAFTLTPPVGWDTVSNTPANSGIPEWAGWSFARQDFWENIGASTGDLPGRDQFRPRSPAPPMNLVAVADSDLWNDPNAGDPANELGFFSAQMFLPEIDLDRRGDQEDRFVLSFDASWMGIECCDDGARLGPLEQLRNNQTAYLRVNRADGTSAELLRWEAAPFFDGQGLPTNDPGTATSPNTPNPNYVPFFLDEQLTFTFDLADLLGSPPGPISSASGSSFLALASAGGTGISFEFGFEQAGDDGWLALDNVSFASFASVFGDMNLSGALDVGDYDAFALGMLDTDAYRADYWGTYPAENGSIDSDFNFDDIPDFLAAMEGVGAPATAFATAFFAAVPEPSSAVGLLACISLVGLGRRS